MARAPNNSRAKTADGGHGPLKRDQPVANVSARAHAGTACKAASHQASRCARITGARSKYAQADIRAFMNFIASGSKKPAAPNGAGAIDYRDVAPLQTGHSSRFEEFLAQNHLHGVKKTDRVMVARRPCGWQTLAPLFPAEPYPLFEVSWAGAAILLGERLE